MWYLAAVAAAGSPIGEVAVGAWPIAAPAWQLVHDDLRTVWYPEPTVLGALALGSDHRTRWQFGLQADVFHRRWTWEDEPYDAVTAFRVNARVGARTDLGDPERSRMDLWLEYGGGWALVPARTPEHRLYTQHSPSLHLHLGLARGLGNIRPFVLAQTRIGLYSGGIPGCGSDTEVCHGTHEFPAGPGLGLVVGLTH